MATATNTSVPIKLLHEGEGRTVTVELKNGEIYRGHLSDSEDTMNCHMSNVTMTAKDGRLTKLELVYLRGSQIKFVILPNILKESPMFKKIQSLKKPNDEKKPNKGKRNRGTSKGTK